MTTTARTKLNVDRLLAKADRHLKSGEVETAEKLFRTIRDLTAPVRQGPGGRAHALAVFRLAQVLERAGRLGEALEAYQRLSAPEEAGTVPEPVRFAAISNAGNILRRRGRFTEALAAFDSAIAIRPDPLALLSRARVLRKLERHREALDTAAEAVARDPSQFSARLFECVAQIRAVPASAADMDADRAAYAERLEALAADVAAASEAERANAAGAVGLVQPFYLTYQARDDRALQETYGRMMCRLMAARHPRHARPLPPRRRAAGEPVRVGLVSRFLMSTHAVWRVPTSGWIRAIDRERFRLHAYVTDDARAVVPQDEALFHVVRRGRKSVAEWAEIIARDELDVLLFPEFGMDPVALPLGALRLAPFQATTWAHPTTSGMPTIDAFLSSALMEPEEADASYTEALVRLPNLSFTPQRQRTAWQRVDRAVLGLSERDVLYWCSQSLYKYHPAHDGIFPKIAREVPHARFVFSAKYAGRSAEIFAARMERVFAEHGLDAARHCVFRHGIPKAEYMGLCAQADVFLDSVGWSGCNTTFDVLEFDVPVVTLPSGLMRGRHTAAILAMMGMADGLAADEADYVARAARLGLDADWRLDVSERIGAAKHRLYGDLSPVRALEALLERAARAEFTEPAAIAEASIAS